MTTSKQTTAKEQLLNEIEQAPDAMIEEVLDFLLFIKSKQNGSEADHHKKTDASQTEVKVGQSLWDLAEKFIQDLPEEEIAKLPTDGAEQHDHYIYGTPKRYE